MHDRWKMSMRYNNIPEVEWQAFYDWYVEAYPQGDQMISKAYEEWKKTLMPEIKHYIVRQTREVKVSANDELGALQIADAAFKHGQDANGGVAKDKAPEGVWGNTDSHIKVADVQIKEV